MKAKILTAFSCSGNEYVAGSEHDLDPETYHHAVSSGLAERVKDAPQKKRAPAKAK